jgi:hypothetical protein
MTDADYEAKLRYERRERERETGLAFTEMLCERLEAQRIPIEALMEPDETREAGGDDAA